MANDPLSETPYSETPYSDIPYSDYASSCIGSDSAISDYPSPSASISSSDIFLLISIDDIIITSALFPIESISEEDSGREYRVFYSSAEDYFSSFGIVFSNYCFFSNFSSCRIDISTFSICR